MWLKLTFYDGNKIVINFNMVEVFGPSEENNAKSYITMQNADSSYHVKETVDEIIHLLTKPLDMQWK